MARSLTPTMTLEERDAKCAELGHPGATFNPLDQKTWCICGAVIHDGDATTSPHLRCCGGPLDRWAMRDPSEGGSDG